MKISLITVTFNCAATLKEAIKCVLDQSYPEIEYIIVDGASKDSTIDIIKKNEPEFKGRLKWISEPDNGIYSAFNKGLSMATGDVIGFINADDTLESNTTIEDIAKAFERTKCQVLFGDLNMVSLRDSSKIVRHWTGSSFKKDSLRLGWMPAHPTLYVAKEIYQQTGSFKENYKIASDYDMTIRIFKNIPEEKTYYLPQTIVKMRVGGVSNQAKNYLNIIKEEYLILKDNNIGSFLTILLKKISKVSQFIFKG